MKSLFTVVVFSLTFSCVFAQSNFQMSVDHLALVVSDLNESSDFYMDVMGFSEIKNNPTGNPDIRWFLVPDGSEMHIIEKEAEIKLNKSVHMAFAVEDLNVFMEHLDKMNVAYEDWPGNEGTSNQRSDGVNQIYLRDPNGYWIEVNDAVD